MANFQDLMKKITWERPFARNSLWNSRPVNPVLAGATFAPESNTLNTTTGTFSPAAFIARATDGPETFIHPTEGSFPRVADEKRNRNFTIPRFPANVVVAAGNELSHDGHLEIFDEVTRMVHCTYKNVKVGDTWTATKYSILPIDGTGFGTYSRPDNSRAAGCPGIAGAMRTFEYGQSILKHALCLILNATNMVAGPVDPATLEDANGGSFYSGTVPMGSLIMLPPTFNVNALTVYELKVVARTLMVYGGRVVDTTVSPFLLVMGEHGSDWNNNTHPNWYTELGIIRDALRVVTSVDSWIDADGNGFTYTPQTDQNIMSLRSDPEWNKSSGVGAAAGYFDTVEDAFIFGPGEGNVNMVTFLNPTIESPTGTGQDDQPCWYWLYGERWVRNPIPGETYLLEAFGEGATINISLQMYTSGLSFISQAGPLTVGQSTTIDIPANSITDNYRYRLAVNRPGTSGTEKIGLRMTRQP